MSTEATQRAFRQERHTGTRAQVLTFLCWKANEDGVAWPKRSRIAGAVNVSKKQVKRHVQALRDAGDLWYRPGRGRGHSCDYVPTVGLTFEEMAGALMAAGLEKGDAKRRAQAQMQRRASDEASEKGDTQGQKGDTDDEKDPEGGGFSKKGTSEKRGHSGGEKGTLGEGVSDPPNDNISNPPNAQTMDKQTPPDPDSAGARRESGRGPWWFLPERDGVYRQTMQASAEEFSPTSIDQLVRRHWGGYRQGQLPLRDLVNLLEGQQKQYGKDEGFRRFVAGVVISGNEADTPGLKFLKRVLDNIDKFRRQQDEQSANENGRAEDEKDEWALVDG